MNNKEIEQSAIDRFGSPRKLEDIPKEEIYQAVDKFDSYSEIRLYLGVGSCSCSDNDLREYCNDLNIPISHLDVSHYEINKLTSLDTLSNEELQWFTDYSYTFASLARKLHVCASHLHEYLDRRKINYDHFDQNFLVLRFDKLCMGSNLSKQAAVSLLAHYGVTSCEICGNKGSWENQFLSL